MAPRFKPLSDRQLVVLRWISDGCPERDWPDFTHKATALALQNRRLVQVSKKGGVWAAHITKAGRHYLDHGAYPAQEPTPQAPSRPVARRKVKPTPSAPAPARTPPAPSTPAVSPSTVRLVERVLQAPGQRVVVESPQYSSQLKSDLDEASARGLIPAGKMMRTRRRGWHQNLVYVTDDPTAVVPRGDIQVPQRVAAFHAVARAYRDDTNYHAVSGDSLARATRVFHALAVDLSAAGWSISTPARPGHQRRSERSQLQLERDGLTELLFISEKSAPGGEKIPYPSYWDNRPRLPAWQAQRQTKFIPTGNLVLVIGGAKYATAQDGRKFRFADGKRQRLEDQLGGVVHELDMRLFTHHEEQCERRIEADETERRWLRAVESAKQRAAADFREAEIRRRAAAWEEAESVRTFARALAASAHPGDSPTAQWILWSKDLAQRVDPLTGADDWPSEPEWTSSTLEPYLKGWSNEFLRRLY